MFSSISFRSPFHYNKDWNATSVSVISWTKKLQESFPLQQGLKHSCIAHSNHLFRLQESFPLQQGLKLIRPWKELRMHELQESFPLQQGLKLHKSKHRALRGLASGVLSTTTRIETPLPRKLLNDADYFRSPFHYNKDWNKIWRQNISDWNSIFRSPFHYNKDWNV